jgi:hypothetical protein
VNAEQQTPHPAQDLPSLASLHRYFMWANKMRILFCNEISERSSISERLWYDNPGMFMSMWYGMLYVVVEGYKELGVHDAKIDQLLSSQNVELLRRYRNGVFHFQRDYFDERFLNFIKESEATVPWMHELTSSFSDFFLRQRPAREHACSKN